MWLVLPRAFLEMATPDIANVLSHLREPFSFLGCDELALFREIRDVLLFELLELREFDWLIEDF